MKKNEKPRVTFEGILEEAAEAVGRMEAEEAQEKERRERKRMRGYREAKEAFLELPPVVQLDCIMALEYGSAWEGLDPETKGDLYDILDVSSGVNVYISPAVRAIAEAMIVEGIARARGRGL